MGVTAGSSRISARQYPPYPRTGVGVLVFRENRLLMVQRDREPAKGLWTIPGGLVELGESLEKAAHREIAEECSIGITDLHKLDVFEYIEKDQSNRIKYHYVVIDFFATHAKGKLKPGSDIADARWLKADEALQFPTTPSTRSLIHKALDFKKAISGDQTI